MQVLGYFTVEIIFYASVISTPDRKLQFATSQR